MTINEVLNLAGITTDEDTYTACAVLGAKDYHGGPYKPKEGGSWREQPWNGVVNLCRYKWVPERIMRALDGAGIPYRTFTWADMRN